jgi:hypothetical protein
MNCTDGVLGTRTGDLVRVQVLLGNAVLALAGLAEDDRHPVGRSPRLDPTRQPTGHPHQMSVIELVIRAVQPPPPHPEPARVVP